MTIFHIFGSASSIDRDVLVFVDTLPTLEASKLLAAQLAPTIQAHFEEVKKSNINFGILRDGVIIETLKGIPDETNNAVLATYGFHSQPYPLAITHRVSRDLHAKYQRTARVILSFYSRTPHREGDRGSAPRRAPALARSSAQPTLDPPIASAPMGSRLGQAYAAWHVRRSRRRP